MFFSESNLNTAKNTTFGQIQSDNIYQMIRIMINNNWCFCLVLFSKWDALKTDYNKRLIALTAITLRYFRCSNNIYKWPDAHLRRLTKWIRALVQ